MRRPCKFQCVSRLGIVTARQSSSGHQPNIAALNIGRHQYSAGRPSRWAFAHILVLIYINDLEEEVVSKVFKFADDTKLFRQVSDTVDALGMQED